MNAVSNKTLEKLKYDLVRDGLIQYEDIEKAQEIALAQNQNIAQVILNSNLINEQTLLKFLEGKLHIPYVDLDDYQLDKKCLEYISYADAQKFRIIPLFKIEDTLTVAMADPLDLFAIDKVVEKTKCNIEPIISSEILILKKIDECYQNEIVKRQISINKTSPKVDWREELHSENLSEEHIQNLIKSILKQALCSNVHELFFEHVPDGLNVNFKSGTDIIQTGTIPKLLITPFISRLKTIANLDRKS